MVSTRDLSAERRRALDESPADLAARDERNRQFFLSSGAIGVVTALTQYGQQESNSSSSQESGEETKEDSLIVEVDEEEEEEEEEVVVGESEGSLFRGDAFRHDDFDDRAAADLPQEPPVDPYYCRFCLNTPCIFLQHQEELERIMEEMHPHATNRTKRFHMYRRMSRELNGPLGKGVRKRLPHCFVQGFRDLYPSEDDTYTGYRDARCDGNDGSVIV
jgi:hypothetical protein